MVLYIDDIVSDILSYYDKSEVHLRETALCLDSNYIELTSDYPHYTDGIRGVGIGPYSPNCYNSCKDKFYTLYVDSYFLRKSNSYEIYDENDYFWSAVLVSNDNGLKELNVPETCILSSIIDLSDFTFYSCHCPLFSLDGYFSLLDSGLKYCYYKSDDKCISLKHVVHKSSNDSIKEFADNLISFLSFRNSFIKIDDIDLENDKRDVLVLLDLVDFSYHESSSYLKDLFSFLGSYLSINAEKLDILFEIETYFSSSDTFSNSLYLIESPLHYPSFKFLDDYRKKGSCIIYTNFIDYSFRE